jgi:lycopene cyclase domain-containing protein
LPNLKFEYIIFNLIVIAGPLSLSFDRKVHFVDKWKNTFSAILLPFVVFTVWDMIVTGRHWWFSHDYTLNVRFLNLPPGEWLFFITVPFATIFTWEVLAAYFKNRDVSNGRLVNVILYLGMPAGIILLIAGKEYTGLVLIVLGLTSVLDYFCKTEIFRQLRTYQYIAIIIGLILVFNGFLTARPVVLYGEIYQLGFRIFTIPIEDFGYGLSYLLLCTIIYENRKRDS